MKTRVVFLALCMIMSIMLSGQNQSAQLMEVKVTPPKFTGIENIAQFEDAAKTNLLDQYVADNFVCPKNSNFTQGTEVIAFKITAEGQLTNVKVINSVSKEADEEIIRILESTEGMWKPGYNNGQPVSMDKELAFKIKIAVHEKFAQNNDFEDIAGNYFNKGTNHLLVSGKFKKALKNFNNGIRYCPYDQGLHYMRGLCHYELGQTEEAIQDWKRHQKLGGIDLSESYAEYNIKDLKGYEELTAMFTENKK